MVKEAAVGFMVSFPVHTMDFRIIELIVDLTPCVIEYILTFHSRTIVEVGLESDILGLAVAEIHLGQTAAANHIHLVFILAGIHESAYTLGKLAHRTLLEITLPEVVSILKSGAIIQLVAFF